MKEAKKLNNIIIREVNKKPFKEEVSKVKPNSQTNVRKKVQKEQSILSQKQLSRNQNLTQEEQQLIIKEASKTMNKKVKATEKKIQTDMIEFLERECQQLCQQLEKEKSQNQCHQKQTAILRQNIAFMNQKLQKIYKDNQSLSRCQNYTEVEKQDLKEELQKLKDALRRKDIEIDTLKQRKEKEVQSLKTQIVQLKSELVTEQEQNYQFQDKNQQLLRQLSECRMNFQHAKDSFQEKRKQWDRYRVELQVRNKTHIEKKGEKITKCMGDIQSLTDKLNEEESMRRKLKEKNKEMQKQLKQKQEMNKDLQNQLTAMKKRVNDLSVLKSNNHAIMGEKLTKLSQQNQRLKAELQGNKGKKISQEKPLLFGADEFD